MQDWQKIQLPNPYQVYSYSPYFRHCVSFQQASERVQGNHHTQDSMQTKGNSFKLQLRAQKFLSSQCKLEATSNQICSLETSFLRKEHKETNSKNLPDKVFPWPLEDFFPERMIFQKTEFRDLVCAFLKAAYLSKSQS